MPTDHRPPGSFSRMGSAGSVLVADPPEPDPLPERPSPLPVPRFSVTPRRQWMVLREGPFWERGRVHEFPPEVNEGTLGRSFSCRWHVGDPSVSRIHCALVRRPRRGVYLLDLSSRHGTFVNGERVTEEVLLMDGDRIGLGDRVVLEFVDGNRPEVDRDRRWLRRSLWSLAGLAIVALIGALLF